MPSFIDFPIKCLILLMLNNRLRLFRALYLRPAI